MTNRTGDGGLPFGIQSPVSNIVIGEQMGKAEEAPLQRSLMRGSLTSPPPAPQLLTLPHFEAVQRLIGTYRLREMLYQG